MIDRPRSLALLVLLIALVLAGCKSESKSSSGGEEEPEEEAENSEATESESPNTPPTTDPSEGTGETPSDDLAFQDTMRVLQTTGAWLVMESLEGAENSDVRLLRKALADTASTEVAADDFPQVLSAYVIGELRPWKHAHLTKPIEAAENALQSMVGDADMETFANAIHTLRDAPEEFAYAGALFDLAQGLKALEAGSGSDGSPAFGVVHASVCPGAPWVQGNVAFEIAAAGSMPADVDAVYALRTCYEDRCPNAAEVTTARDLVTALDACEAVALPETDLSLPVFDSPLSVVNLLAVGVVVDARARLAESGFLIDDELRTLIQRSIDQKLGRTMLTFDWPMDASNLPEFAGVPADRAKLSYLLMLNDEATFGVWPHFGLERGKLELARVHGPTGGQHLQRAVNLGSASSMQRTISPELRATAGIIASSDTSVARLRRALQSTRALRLEERLIAVQGEGASVRWIPLDSKPDTLADAVIQQAGGVINVWVHPGGVSESAMEALPADSQETWPGTTTRIRRATLEEALPQIKTALGSGTVKTVLLDLNDHTTLGDVIALVKTVEGTLPDSDRPPGRRLDGIVFTEQPGATMPGTPEIAAEGVTLPTRDEISVAGPLTVDDVLERLATLEHPLTLCYEREAVEFQELAGTIILQIALDTTGAVSTTSTIENTTGNEMLQACLEDGVEILGFPVPEGNAELAVIKIPVHFDPIRGDSEIVAPEPDEDAPESDGDE